MSVFPTRPSVHAGPILSLSPHCLKEKTLYETSVCVKPCALLTVLFLVLRTTLQGVNYFPYFICDRHSVDLKITVK